jgi:hypothetical protein
VGGVVLTVERSWARDLADVDGISAHPVDDHARPELIITTAGARRRTDHAGVRARTAAAAHDSAALDDAAAHDSAATTPHDTAAARDRAAYHAADDTTDRVVEKRAVSSRAGSAG